MSSSETTETTESSCEEMEVEGVEMTRITTTTNVTLSNVFKIGLGTVPYVNRTAITKSENIVMSNGNEVNSADAANVDVETDKVPIEKLTLAAPSDVRLVADCSGAGGDTEVTFRLTSSESGSSSTVVLEGLPASNSLVVSGQGNVEIDNTTVNIAFHDITGDIALNLSESTVMTFATEFGVTGDCQVTIPEWATGGAHFTTLNLKGTGSLRSPLTFSVGERTLLRDVTS